jgi:23S rRNA pseudouridine2605 synthase
LLTPVEITVKHYTMSQSHFQKFVPKKKNSLVKEEFKQAKKKAKKERAAAIDKRFEEKRRMRAEARNLSLNLPAAIAKKGTTKEDKIKAIETNFEQVQKIEDIKKEFAEPVQKVEKKAGKPVKPAPISTQQMPLNKYLAHCGVCSRRDAVTIIKEGKVKVNGTAILEPAFKVTERDEVLFNGKKLFVSKNLVYILLNKPKDYITTTDDPQGRKTVLQLTKMATTERIYPVGRLDRNTSGVLLLTNDGELTQKLSHPSYNITKVYEAKLDKALTKADFDKILTGIKLEDGEIKADSLAYADNKDKSVIGIEIHSGRNRIVRRIFESLGYDVKALDRVMYATLTKKNVERGKWRFLAEKEVRLLKYLNASHKKIAPKEKAETTKK